jgi:hypothetical protein
VKHTLFESGRNLAGSLTIRFTPYLGFGTGKTNTTAYLSRSGVVSGLIHASQNSPKFENGSAGRDNVTTVEDKYAEEESSMNASDKVDEESADLPEWVLEIPDEQLDLLVEKLGLVHDSRPGSDFVERRIERDLDAVRAHLDSIIETLSSSELSDDVSNELSEELQRVLIVDGLLRSGEPKVADPKPEWRGIPGALRRSWCRSNGWLGACLARMRRPGLHNIEPAWGPVGLGINGLISLLVLLATADTASAGTLLSVATGLVAIRVLISMMVGPSDPRWLSKRFTTDSPSPVVYNRNFFGCLFSHVGDMVIAAACTVFLVQEAHPLAGVILALSIGTALTGTLTRVSGERCGWAVPRAPMERVVRNTGLLVGLTVTARDAILNQPIGLGLLAYAAALTAYAVVDITRVLLAKQQSPAFITTFQISAWRHPTQRKMRVRMDPVISQIDSAEHSNNSVALFASRN